jgi:DNA-binding transcriptional ArsR family regulator
MTGNGESYWILSGDQLDCLASSRRQAILDLIATFGPVSADDLARLSGMRRTTIYQHIAKLESAGLVLASGQKGSGPKTEQLYQTPARRMRLAKALDDDRNAASTNRIAAALLRQTQRDIEAGMVSGRKTALGPETNLLFHRFVGTASGENLTEINRKIEELKALIYTEAPAAGQPIAITIAMAPVDRV